MARVRDLLDRFRPAGAPGAATAAGVPVDRRAQIADELEPVFAALADVRAECEALRRAGVAAAGRLEAETAERVSALVSRARADAEAERADAATRVREQATRMASRAMAGALAEAGQIRRRDERGQAECVARVLDRVRADLGDLGPGVGAKRGTA